jgi:hypothetical protein
MAPENMNEMDSEQEEIVRQITEHAMGAPFAFKPDTYIRGGKVKHPPDLVWACNDCLILICMYSGTDLRQNMQNHNFLQLKGFLRLWKDGVAKLSGKNHFQTFEIDWKDYRRFVLVSVVGGPESTAEYHPDLFEQFQKAGHPVSLCATLPDVTLKHLAVRGGSAIDLILLIDEVRATKTILKVPESAAIVERIVFQPIAPLAKSLIGKGTLKERLFHDLSEAVHGHRLPPGIQVNKGGDFIFRVAAIFNDLSWKQSFSIISFIAISIEQLDKVPIGSHGTSATLTSLGFEPHEIVIGVLRETRIKEQLNNFADKLGRLHIEAQKKSSSAVAIFVIRSRGGFTMSLAFMNDPAPVYRATARIVDKLTEAQLSSKTN